MEYLSLSDKNPYLKFSNSDERTITITHNGICHDISYNLYKKGLSLEEKRNFMLYYTSFDLIISFFYILLGMWPATITLLINILGLWGAKNFNKLAVQFYLYFLYLAFIFRIVIVVSYSNEIIQQETGDVILYSIMSLIQIVIIYFTHIFYKELPTEEPLIS